jgi:secreted PhoX family phosphatase
LVAACGESAGVKPPVSTPDAAEPEAAPPDAVPEAAPPPVLGFNPVSKSLADALVLPAGYTATVLYRLGDSAAENVPDSANDGTDSGESHALRAGDHHDGMHYFGLGANGRYDAAATDRALLVLNHEALTPSYLHVTGQTISGRGVDGGTVVDTVRTIPDDRREMNVQGVSVIEIANSGKGVQEELPSTAASRPRPHGSRSRRQNALPPDSSTARRPAAPSTTAPTVAPRGAPT